MNKDTQCRRPGLWQLLCRGSGVVGDRNPPPANNIYDSRELTSPCLDLTLQIKFRHLSSTSVRRLVRESLLWTLADELLPCFVTRNCRLHHYDQLTAESMLPPNTTQDDSKPRKPPQLPFEIHDLTLSHLQDNKGALDRCSLVSRSWLQLSRHYLFRTLAVASSRGSFSNFILLLRTAQYVGESIETLTLRGPPPSAAEAMSPSASHLPVVSPDLLYRLAERTPKLKTLVLARVRFLPNSNSTSNLDSASESYSNSSSTMPEPLDGGSDAMSRKLRKLILASTTHRPVALGVPSPPPRHPNHTLTSTTVDGAHSLGRDVSASVPPRLSLGLERLHLTYMTSIPEEDVPNILAAIAVFSEIGELGLYHLTAPTRLVRFRGSPTLQLRSQECSPVRSLDVSAGHATFSSAVYGMLEHLVTRGMTALSWASNNMLLLEAFGRFLRPNAPQLRTLKLSVGTWVFDSVTHLPNSVICMSSSSLAHQIAVTHSHNVVCPQLNAGIVSSSSRNSPSSTPSRWSTTPGRSEATTTAYIRRSPHIPTSSLILRHPSGTSPCSFLFQATTRRDRRVCLSRTVSRM